MTVGVKGGKPCLHCIRSFHSSIANICPIINITIIREAIKILYKELEISLSFNFGNFLQNIYKSKELSKIAVIA